MKNSVDLQFIICLGAVQCVILYVIVITTITLNIVNVSLIMAANLVDSR